MNPGIDLSAMKIQIRRGQTPRKPARVIVREKTIYHCNRCRNKYYSHHFFCPQCLGEVISGLSHTSHLQILACQQSPDDVDLLKKLTDNAEYNFEKALSSLPWIFITNTDPAVLKQWKACFDARKISSDIRPGPPIPPKRKRKTFLPMYSSNAPFPHFFPRSMVSGLRESTELIATTSIRLSWAESVIRSLGIVERLYKHPTGVILFYDFIFQIEQQLSEFLESLRTSRWSDTNFQKRLTKFTTFLDQIETEIEAVREQIQEQL